MTPVGKLDPAANPDELARQIANFPDVEIDLAGIGLGSLLTVTRDPMRYGSIFEAAGLEADAKGKRWLASACKVEACNGWRRDPGSDLEQIRGSLQDALECIQTFSEGPGRSLLEANAWYNLALVSRAQRDYSGAAHQQNMASMIYAAAGLVEKGAVSFFLAEVEWATQAISDGTVAVSAMVLQRLRGARYVVQTTCSTYPAWMADNAALHIWWAHVMAGQAYVEQGADEMEVGQSRMPHWADLPKIHAALRDSDYQAALGTADQSLAKFGDIKSSSRENPLLTAQLFKAWALFGLGRMAEARMVAEEVANWSGRDGGVPMGVAERWLATLPR